MYLTASDAELILLNPPDPRYRNHRVDAVHFVLTGGRTPLHIWNYARRPDPAVSGFLGEEGGAPFDDTALGNQIVQLQLVINRDRLANAMHLFSPQTRLGDLELRYAASDASGRSEQIGYRLLDGRIAGRQEQYRPSDPTSAFVQILFRDFEPLSSMRPPPTAVTEAPAGALSTLFLYEVTYQINNGLPRAYHPHLAPVDFLPNTEYVVDSRVRFLGNQFYKGTLSDFQAGGVFVGAAVEGLDPEGRTLFLWNPCRQQYLPIQTSTTVVVPIILEDTLPDPCAEILGKLMLRAGHARAGLPMPADGLELLLNNLDSLGCS